MHGKITLVDATSTPILTANSRSTSSNEGTTGTGIITNKNTQTDWEITPSQPRPKQLKIVKAKAAANRFRAATTKAQGCAGKVIYDNQEAAEAILKMLKMRRCYSNYFIAL
jgi:electron transfer flavoprotein beta subunit